MQSFNQYHNKLFHQQRFEEEYKLFEQYYYSLNEASIEIPVPSKLKKGIDFIKEIVEISGQSLKDVMNMFLDKKIFKFFSLIGWSLKKLYNIIKKGFEAYNELQHAIAEWISHTKIGHGIAIELEKFDEFLEAHPNIKKISGIAVAGILIFMWLNMTFTGSFSYDFDMSTMIEALEGDFTLTDLFSGPSGIRLLVLFTSGMVLGLTFPWPGPTHLLFATALIKGLHRYREKKSKR